MKFIPPRANYLIYISFLTSNIRLVLKNTLFTCVVVRVIMHHVPYIWFFFTLPHPTYRYSLTRSHQRSLVGWTRYKKNQKPCVCVWKKAPSTFLLSVGSLTKSGVFSSLVQYFSRVLCYTNTIQTFLYHAIEFDRFLTEIKGAGYQFAVSISTTTKRFFETKISKHHSFHMTT